VSQIQFCLETVSEEARIRAALDPSTRKQLLIEMAAAIAVVAAADNNRPAESGEERGDDE
jgi:hypothetical protein